MKSGCLLGQFPVVRSYCNPRILFRVVLISSVDRISGTIARWFYNVESWMGVLIIHSFFLKPFTKLWQSCSDPHLEIRPIAIFAFCSLNFSLAACLQDNSGSKSPISTKVETENITAIYCLWMVMNGGESSSEKRKKPLRLKLHSIYSIWSMSTTTSFCLHESLFS